MRARLSIVPGDHPWVMTCESIPAPEGIRPLIRALRDDVLLEEEAIRRDMRWPQFRKGMWEREYEVEMNPKLARAAEREPPEETKTPEQLKKEKQREQRRRKKKRQAEEERIVREESQLEIFEEAGQVFEEDEREGANMQKIPAFQDQPHLDSAENTSNQPQRSARPRRVGKTFRVDGSTECSQGTSSLNTCSAGGAIGTQTSLSPCRDDSTQGVAYPRPTSKKRPTHLMNKLPNASKCDRGCGKVRYH